MIMKIIMIVVMDMSIALIAIYVCTVEGQVNLLGVWLLNAQR